MQSTTIISNKLDAAVAKQILNYKEGEIKIIMGMVDTNLIVDALAVNININKVTLVADEMSYGHQEISKIITNLAVISSLKEMILDLSKAPQNQVSPTGYQKVFSNDFQRQNYNTSFTVIRQTILSEISVDKIKTIETLKVIGNLRLVDLGSILKLSSLRSLDFSGCSITYDTFLPFVTNIPEKLPLLNILNVNNNPIAIKSIDEDKNSINNLFTCMTQTLKQSEGKLIISMDGCFMIGCYTFPKYNTLSGWKPIEAMLAEAKQRQSVEHLQVMYKDLQELSEEVAVLELSKEQLQHNTRFQRNLQSKQEELQQLCEDIEKSLTILDDIGFDGHYIHAQIKESNEEFDEAYKLLNVIPNSHKDYAEAQHKMAMLVAKIEQPSNILDLNDILVEPKDDIDLQKLTLHLQLANNVAQLQAPSDANHIAGVLTIANNAAGKYVTGQFGALLQNPGSKFGCNLNTIATLLQRLKEANTVVGKLSVNLESLEQTIKELCARQAALSNQVVDLAQANRQAQPLIVRQFAQQQANHQAQLAQQQPKSARRKSGSDIKFAKCAM